MKPIAMKSLMTGEGLLPELARVSARCYGAVVSAAELVSAPVGLGSGLGLG